jgi:hypothetical protein
MNGDQLRALSAASGLTALALAASIAAAAPPEAYPFGWATVVETGMDGTLIDPEAIDDVGNALPVTEMGLERDGLRARWLAINVTMGSEETGWAGIYLTDIAAR